MTNNYKDSDTKRGISRILEQYKNRGKAFNIRQNILLNKKEIISILPLIY